MKSLYTTTNVQLSKAISDSFYVGDMSKQASDYFMYESSKTFFGTPMVDISSLSNVLVDIRTLESVQDGTYDKHRIIRKPLLAIKNNTALVYSSENEKYPPKYLRLTYIRKPTEFTILGDNPVNCELPTDCFEDLVTGAVELFFNYKYKVSLAQQAAKARAKKNKEDKEDDND